MSIIKLRDQLMAAYSTQNLHKIAVILINLFKEKQFGTLQHIVDLISERIDIKIDPDHKYFSRLMMLYHPDRGQYHRDRIYILAEKNNHDALWEYSHILLMEKIEEVAHALSSYEDIDYSPVYEWDISMDGFHIVGENISGGRENLNNEGRKNGISFSDAIKLRMLGKKDISIPLYYFEDIEELELSHSGIDDLEGIQFCIHAKSIDLSCNTISDISLLWNLSLLEHINLADNKLELIDTLSNLQNLKSIILSDNILVDISPLMQLNKLEYVELSGNKVSKDKIRELMKLGITVECDK